MSSSSDPINTDFQPHRVEVHGHKVQLVTRPALEPQPGDALPLVLVGGMGANYALLRPLLSYFPQFDVVVIEPPGSGGSSTPDLPIAMETFAKIARDSLAQLGYQRVNLMGVSWGGALAQEFAHRFPKACEKLILVSTSPGLVSVPASASVLSKYLTPRRFTEPGYMEQVAGELYGGMQKSNPEIATKYARDMRMKRGSGYYWQLWAASTWTSYYWLHQLEQPTLIIAGDDDPLVPLKNANILANHIPNAELQVLQDGHLVFLSQPEKVSRLVQDFLARPA